jgi:5'-3' exonuclease
MGIRGILGILLGGLGSGEVALINPKKMGFRVSRMYIDAIQFIHKALALIKSEALQAGKEAVSLSDDQVIDATSKLILDVIKEINPQDFLGIYFDGIPPIAKVVEQRARRYEMSLDPGTFNKAKITIGTAFLRLVTERVLKELAENEVWLPKHIEVSTQSEPGEGEHKLANRIRDHDNMKPGAKVIVSDDGDVLIMSLLNGFREAYIYVDHQSPRARHGLVSVASVAERVVTRLQNTPTAIQDFCAMVILSGGNDFMPLIQSARDRRNIMQDLLDMYPTVLRRQPLMTNQGREIVWSSVRSLIMQLAANEERNLKRLADFTKKQLNGKMPSLYSRSLDPNTGEFKLLFFRKAWDDEIYGAKAPLPEGLDLPRPSQKEIDADHANCAVQYLQGLEWTLGYMRTGDGPTWYYQPGYPPLFGDISRIMAEIKDPTHSLRSLPRWEPLSLAEYLLVVLPKSTTRDLFGESFANAFALSVGLGDLFPLKFEHFNPAEWDETMKGRAILPPLGLDRIHAAVEEKLDIDVIERNVNSLKPRVAYSRSKAKWVQTLPDTPERSTRDRTPASATGGYKVLDVVIPDLS